MRPELASPVRLLATGATKNDPNGLPPGEARAMRVEHDYERRGALAYLAAWDVHRGRVTGRCEDTTGIARSRGWSSR